MLASHRADIARDIKALIEPAQVKILEKAERRKNYTQLSATIPYEWRMHLNHILYDAEIFSTRTSIPEALLGNKNFMLAAVTQYGRTLDYASPTLQADKEVVMAAVTQYGHAFCFASTKLKANKEIAMAAVRQNGFALRHAAPKLHADKDVVIAAVMQNSLTFHNAAGKLKKDKKFILRCAKINLDVLNYTELHDHEIQALKIKALEELIVEGQIGKAKNDLDLRHEPKNWGNVTAQFGDDRKHIDNIIREMKATMSEDARKSYDDLSNLPLSVNDSKADKPIAKPSL